MTYRDIVVYLDTGPATSARVDAAVELARRFEARLTAVNLVPAVSFDGDWQLCRDSLQTSFEEAASRAGVVHNHRDVPPDASAARDFFAHDADLLVVTQPDRRNAGAVPVDFPGRLLLAAGVPLLMLPLGWNGAHAIGRRPTVAWNGTGEATRAAHDALPFLRDAERTALFTFDARYGLGETAVEGFAAHLHRHGAGVVVDGWRDDGRGEWLSALFASVDRERSDLIVAGAYGHPRIAERLFGGATQDLLGQDLLPVLLSH